MSSCATQIAPALDVTIMMATTPGEITTHMPWSIPPALMLKAPAQHPFPCCRYFTHRSSRVPPDCQRSLGRSTRSSDPLATSRLAHRHISPDRSQRSSAFDCGLNGTGRSQCSIY